MRAEPDSAEKSCQIGWIGRPIYLISQKVRVYISKKGIKLFSDIGKTFFGICSCDKHTVQRWGGRGGHGGQRIRGQ